MTVADTGIGIEKEKHELIFAEFYQSDQTRDSALGGTGIGLALTRRLVELHGGEVGVESEPGKGSLFWFEIPSRELPRKTAPEPAEDEPPAPDAVGRRILVAEDNEVNQLLIVEILRLGGHQVTLVSDGEEAVKAAANETPDVILMDVQMPVMDGLEATRRIRALSGPVGRVPVFALTAKVNSDSVRECLEAGCTGHLPKPLDPDVLLRAIADLPLGPVEDSPQE